jgi:hypothetical protein
MIEILTENLPGNIKEAGLKGNVENQMYIDAPSSK